MLTRKGGLLYRSHRLEPVVQYIADPVHSRGPIATQISTPCAGGGPMGVFVKSYAELTKPIPRNLDQVMGYVFDFFASNFAICEHWFAALPAGTQPNRLMAIA